MGEPLLRAGQPPDYCALRELPPSPMLAIAVSTAWMPKTPENAEGRGKGVAGTMPVVWVRWLVVDFMALLKYQNRRSEYGTQYFEKENFGNRIEQLQWRRFVFETRGNISFCSTLYPKEDMILSLLGTGVTTYQLLPAQTPNGTKTYVS